MSQEGCACVPRLLWSSFVACCPQHGVPHCAAPSDSPGHLTPGRPPRAEDTFVWRIAHRVCALCVLNNDDSLLPPSLCVLVKGRGCPAWQTRDVRGAPAFTEPLASTPGGIGALRTEPATDLSCGLLRTIHTVGFSPSTSIFTYRTDALGTVPVRPQA